MRWYVVYLAFCCAFILAVSCCLDPALLHGTVEGECADTICLVEEPNEIRADPIEEERVDGDVMEASIAEPSERSVFTAGGVYRTEISQGFDEDVVLNVERKIKDTLSGDVVKYEIFGSEEGMLPLRAVLNETELAYVFTQTICSTVRSLPISAELTEIGFDVREDRLIVDMRVAVLFDEFVKKCPVSGIPTTATFRYSAVFYLKNSVISVQNEGLSLECETYPITRSLLEFGCNVLFGVKDPQMFFAKMIKNVFVNAGIYR